MVVTPIDKLCAIRSALLTSFDDGSEAFQKLVDTPKIKSRQAKTILKQLTAKLDKISDLTDEIVELLDSADEIAKEVKSIDILRDRFIGFTTAMEDATNPGSADENSTNGNAGNVKLPKMNLKPFDGDIFHWRTFWQRFESTIHKNNTLSKIDRFNYLESLLIGDAAKVIEGLPLAEETYDDAIELLKDRFDKPDIIISACMQSLLALPEVKKPSLVAFRKLVDSCRVHVRSLAALGVTSGHYSALLCPVLLSKIPEDTRRLWTRQAKANCNDLNLLLDFLNEEFDSIQRCESFGPTAVEAQPRAGVEARPKPKSELRAPKREPATIGAFNTTVTDAPRSCLYCRTTDHATFSCPKPVAEKRDVLSKGGRCFNCTKPGHRVKECPTSRSRCRNCKGLHHTSICQGIRKTDANPEGVEAQATNVSVNIATSTTDDVLLQTATVLIEGPKGNQLIRCLVDGGSQRSFITERLANSLDFKPLGTELLRIQAFGSSHHGPPKNYEWFSVIARGHMPDSEPIELRTVAVPNIAAIVPNAPYRSVLMQIASEFSPLADFPNEGQSPAGIDLLIGADQYWNVLTGIQHRTRWGPVAVGSKFGWILHGPVNSHPSPNPTDVVSMLIRTHTDPATLDDALVTRFWTVDSMGVGEATSDKIEDQALIQAFKKNLVYDNNRYSVSLPWKLEPSSLDVNFEHCHKRLRSLLSKLQRQPKILDAYVKTLAEYEEAQFITEVPITFSDAQHPLHYLPHQPVIREDKVSSKVRIVFDASAKTLNGPSLNDYLECGPALNLDLMHILLTFRTYKIPLLADIEKAFPQIEINPNDRNVLRFLWVRDPSNPNSELVAFRWNRLIFGMKSSPFILAATIQHHLSKERPLYPDTVDTLSNSMYVDDVVAGANSVDEAVKFVAEARTIFCNAGMNLRRWTTSEPGLQEQIEPGNTDEPITFHGQESVKVLGLVWKSLRDTFSFNSLILLTEAELKNLTKRKMVSAIAKLFDPLGLVSPVVVAAKILIQQLWVLGIAWDDVVPEPLTSEFTKWIDSLRHLPRVSIPRFLQCAQDPMEVHIFCDASKKAYGTVAYTRLRNSEQPILLVSKTRVAPLKELSLPRLELLAALLAAKLWSYIQPVFAKRKLEVTPTFWTDSQITLAWIKSPPGRWRQFVGNRVTQIQELTPPAAWHHCPGDQNPADLASRGMIAEQLVENSLWWHGPSFLIKDDQDWSRDTTAFNSEEPADALLESRKEPIACFNVVVQPEAVLDIARFSRASRVIRITAWIFRFISRLKKQEVCHIPFLTSEEIQRAEEYWCKEVQGNHYRREIDALREGKPVSKTSSLFSLQPFLDPLSKLLRVRGRIQFSASSEAKKFPVILPNAAKFTHLIVEATHRRLLHAGVQDTLAELRERFWIPKGRQTVKKIIQSCVICRRYHARSVQEEVAPLPKDRVIETPPFQTCGVDYFGPVYLKNAQTSSKHYVLLFTCATTRAIHLEITTDLSTQHFLLAFRRFIARRGISEIIYSDNATTFKKADKELKKLFLHLSSNQVQDFLAQRKITWKFIAERSPWWGGFWERLVRSVKTSLRKTLGHSRLTFEEFGTILCEVESVINSRPLTYLSDSPLEPQPLSPSHFLTGLRLTALPTPPTEDSLPQATHEELNRKKTYYELRTELRTTNYELNRKKKSYPSHCYLL